MHILFVRDYYLTPMYPIIHVKLNILESPLDIFPQSQYRVVESHSQAVQRKSQAGLVRDGTSSVAQRIYVF